MIKKIPALSIPPLTYQLLLFVKNSSNLSKDLLSTINHFFSTRLSPEDREGGRSNIDLDSIELVADDNNTADELLQAKVANGFLINHTKQDPALNNLPLTINLH